MKLKIIVCEQEDDGARNYIAEDWTPEAAEAQMIMQTPSGGENLSVYIINQDSGINLLQQEGV